MDAFEMILRCVTHGKQEGMYRDLTPAEQEGLRHVEVIEPGGQFIYPEPGVGVNPKAHRLPMFSSAIERAELGLSDPV